MGASCLNTKKSHPHPSAPKRQREHNVVHPQNYESILSSNEKVFTQAHRSYFTRRYISISTSCLNPLTRNNLKQFFHYLPLGSVLHHLFRILLTNFISNLNVDPLFCFLFSFSWNLLKISSIKLTEV